MQVHLVDGTYELFRQYLAPRPGHRDADGIEVGATRAVVGSILGMLEAGATHLGVATDHVIESFRNDLWPDYKTGEGIDPELFAQFPLLEDALEALGVAVWPMVELEADDALAQRGRGRGRRPARRAGDHLHARQGPRPVRRRQGRAARPAQGDPARRRRRAREVRRAAGVDPRLARARRRHRRRLSRACPGFGAKTAAALLARYGHIEAIPDDGRTWDVPGLRGADRLAATLAAGRAVAALLQGARDAAHRRRRRHRRRLASGPGRPTELRRLVRAVRIAETPRPRAGAREDEEDRRDRRGARRDRSAPASRSSR